MKCALCKKQKAITEITGMDKDGKIITRLLCERCKKLLDKGGDK